MKTAAPRSLAVLAVGLALSASSCTGSSVSDRDWEASKASDEHFRSAPDQSQCGQTVWTSSAKAPNAWIPMCEIQHKSGIRSTLFGEAVFGTATKGWSFDPGEWEFSTKGTFTFDIKHPQTSYTPSVEFWVLGMSNDSKE